MTLFHQFHQYCTNMARCGGLSALYRCVIEVTSLLTLTNSDNFAFIRPFAQTFQPRLTAIHPITTVGSLNARTY